MKRQHRVVWSKGMFLAPEHFQAQARFIEEELSFRTAVGRLANWGVSELVVDHSSLEEGTFRVLRCSGVMPDGLAFSFGGSETAPASRSFKDLLDAASDEEIDVYLALPETQVDGMNVARAGRPTLRYVAADVDVTNENEYDKGEERVEVAQPSFRIVLGKEKSDGMILLKVGQIGRLGPNPDFIPPCLHIGASERLMDHIVPAILTSLKLVRSKLSGTRSEQTEYLADFMEADIRRFWVLDLANRTLPELNHLYLASSIPTLAPASKPHSSWQDGTSINRSWEDDQAPDAERKARPRSRTGIHPEDLYRLLLRLAGSLCTFSTEAGPLDFPPYDHQNLGKCFSELSERIQSMLKSIVYPPLKFAAIPLEIMEDGSWRGQVETSYFRLGKFFLSLRVRGSLDLQRFASIDRKVKICGETLYPEIVTRALVGAVLQHERHRPRGLPGRFGSEFFQIMPGSVEWTDIEETKRIRILITPSPSEPRPSAFEVEVFALLQ
jgi:type VI secretion system protein ImpJ